MPAAERHEPRTRHRGYAAPPLASSRPNYALVGHLPPSACAVRDPEPRRNDQRQAPHADARPKRRGRHQALPPRGGPVEDRERAAPRPSGGEGEGGADA
nr:unnamed protein product [Digitaria exilis]